MSTMRLSSVQSSMDLGESLYGNRIAPDRNGEPPSHAQLLSLIEAAGVVPDHGYLQPYRFVVVSGEGRDKLADALVANASLVSDMPTRIEKARQKAYSAPCLIILVASTKPEKPIPVWEQLATAACTGYAIVLAAHALGLGASWRSTSLRDGVALRSFCQCTDDEELLCWVQVGSRPEIVRPKLKSRPPFDPDAFMTIVS